MAPAQHLEPTATAAPDPVLTRHGTPSTATLHVIPLTPETATRGPRRGLRAIIAKSRCDPAPTAPAGVNTLGLRTHKGMLFVEREASPTGRAKAGHIEPSVRRRAAVDILEE